MKQAKIECPNCGNSIIVRQSNDKHTMTEEEIGRLDAAWDEVDKLFDGMSTSMAKLFRAARLK